METRSYINDVTAFILFFGLAFLVLSTAENVPVWDAWHNPQLFDSLYSGKLVFSDLYQEINGHHNFFPRMITLVLGAISHYDLRWELVVNLVLGCGIYGVHRKIVTREFKNGYIFFCASLLVAVLSFSLVQYENWYNGWQLSVFLCILMVMLSLYLLIFSASFGPAILAAYIASYSFASGLLVWPLGLVLILCHKHKSQQTILWLIAGAICMGSYFYGLGSQSSFNFTKLHSYFIYFLVYVGSPVASQNPVLAMTWAAIGLILFVYFLWIWRLSVFKAHSTELFFISLGIFSLLTGLLISVTRLEYGMEYALLSRYTSFPTLFWSSLCLLVLKKASATKESFEKALACFFVAMVMLSSLKGSWLSVKEFYIHEKRMQLAIQELKKENLATVNRNRIKNITWDVDVTLAQAAILKKYRLSLYSE